MMTIKTRICNVKISFKTQKQNVKKLLSLKVITKRTSCFVFKLKHFTYVVYNGGHVNITGIKNLKRVHKSVKTLFKTKITSHSCCYSIDNITATGKLKNKLYGKFSKILQQHENNPYYLIKYSPEAFPGAALKFYHYDGGTIVIFPSGKFIVVGCRTTETIDYCVSVCEHYFTKHERLSSLKRHS